MADELRPLCPYLESLALLLDTSDGFFLEPMSSPGALPFTNLPGAHSSWYRSWCPVVLGVSLPTQEPQTFAIGHVMSAVRKQDYISNFIWDGLWIDTSMSSCQHQLLYMCLWSRPTQCLPDEDISKNFEEPRCKILSIRPRLTSQFKPQRPTSFRYEILGELTGMSTLELFPACSKSECFAIWLCEQDHFLRNMPQDSVSLASVEEYVEECTPRMHMSHYIWMFIMIEWRYLHIYTQKLYI